MARARTELIHCDNCGEDYAATYRRCPFCDAKPGQRFDDQRDDYEEPFDDDDTDVPARQGGKRLSGGGRKNGRGAGFWVRVGLYVLSAAVIIAALWVVCSFLFPRLFSSAARQSEAPSAEPSSSVAADVAAPSASPVADVAPSLGELPAVDDDPLSLNSPDLPAVEPDPIATEQPVSTQTPLASQAPVSQAALVLSSTDFTLSPKYPDYQMEIEGVGRGLASYSIGNEAVATVNATGLVTAVGNGSTKLTVTGPDGATATAIVRVSGMTGQAPAGETPASETPASEAPASEAPSGGARLNYSDFTISAAYPDPVRLRVENGQAASWATGNANVATVSDNGTVTATGNGRTTITCTLTDGSTLSCAVHVSGQ